MTSLGDSLNSTVSAHTYSAPLHCEITIPLKQHYLMYITMFSLIATSLIVSLVGIDASTRLVASTVILALTTRSEDQRNPLIFTFIIPLVMGGGGAEMVQGTQSCNRFPTRGQPCTCDVKTPDTSAHVANDV